MSSYSDQASSFAYARWTVSFTEPFDPPLGILGIPRTGRVATDAMLLRDAGENVAPPTPRHVDRVTVKRVVVVPGRVVNIVTG